jgi:hypothetical protein
MHRWAIIALILASARHPTQAELSALRTVRVEHVQRPALIAIAA